MKGGDVIIIAALKALKTAGALADMNVVVVMTGDEEDSGDPQAAARAALVDAAKGAQYALGFEDGPGDPRFAVTARRGTSSWKLQVKAKTGHSSQIFRPELGYGANYELARILDGFRRKLAGEAHLTFNPSLVLGGTAAEIDDVLSRGSASGKTNVIAATAVAIGDLRTLSKEQLQHARDTMKAVVADGPLAQTEATLTFEDGYPSLPPTDGNARLLAEYDRASRDVGFGAGGRRQPRSRRRGRRLVHLRRRAEHHRRHRPDGARRSLAVRDRRSDDAAQPDQARGDPAVSPQPSSR